MVSYRTPGIVAERTSAFRNVLRSQEDKRLLPGGVIVRGAVSRDPGNTGDVDVLRCGTLLGKITATGLYAPSVIGTLSRAILGTATQLDLLVTGSATEIVRRIGATGTFKITGPQAAGGRVRTRTITYSAVGTGTPVNEVQTFTPDAAATAGTYRIKLQKPDGSYVWTAPIAFGSTLAACQAAITLALGAVAGWVASSAGSAAPFSAGPIALVLTASGTGYTAYDYPMCEIDITALTGVTTMTSVETTKGIPAANTVTITAPGLAAVNEVQTVTLNAAMTAGTLTFGITNLVTNEVEWIRATWDTDWATTMAAWNVLANARLGTSSVVMTGTATVPVFTFSGGIYAGRDNPNVLVDITGVTGPATYVLSKIGGHSEGFIAGSLIQPTDGSETPLGILGKEDGLKVTDDDGVSINVTLHHLIIGGMIDTTQLLPAVTDTSLLAWSKAKLRAASSGFTFDDDF